ncbi:MAG: hypothetical protein Kow0062_09600 [Acidobacteriota bacterium]
MLFGGVRAGRTTNRAALGVGLAAAWLIAASWSVASETSPTDVSYDASEDHTSVGFSEVSVLTRPDAIVQLTVSCGYDGRTPSPPDQCLVIFRVRTGDEGYCQDGMYIMRVGREKSEHQFKNYGCYPDGDWFVADLFTLWPYKHLRQIAAAKRVSFEIRRLRFELDDRILAGIRDIAAHFE